MDWCRKRDLDWIPNLAIKMGGKRLLEGRGRKQDEIIIISEADLEATRNLYLQSIEDLENILGRSLDIWKAPNANRKASIQRP